MLIAEICDTRKRMSVPFETNIRFKKDGNAF